MNRPSASSQTPPVTVVARPGSPSASCVLSFRDVDCDVVGEMFAFLSFQQDVARHGPEWQAWPLVARAFNNFFERIPT